MFIVEMGGFKEAYLDNPNVFLEGHRKAKTFPETATVANDNPYDITTEEWKIWTKGFQNYALSEGMASMAKMLGIKVDHSNHIIVEGE